MAKLVPIVTAANASYFCTQQGSSEPFIYDVLVRDTTVKSGFLLMGKQINLLDLAFDKEMMNSGEINLNDAISAKLGLKAIALGSSKGELLHVIEREDHSALEMFKPPLEGPRSKLQLNFDSKELTFEGINMHLHIVGQIDLQTGNVEVHAVNPRLPESELFIIGYSLDTHRVNPLRRAR